MRRISPGCVLVWVVVMGLAAAGLSIFTYGFVREQAAEADELMKLPRPPQLDRPAEERITPVPAPTETPPPDQTPGAAAPSVPGPTPSAAETPQAPDTGPTPIPPLDDPRRVSVLLMGIDQRAGETGTFPTDTMIVFSLDPAGNTAAILSIPRDLWVEYPALGRSGKINSANIVGDEISYPGGAGPAYALKTAEKVLGIKIQYYVLINFEVFYTLVDAIGPIEVCPAETIHDDRYPDGSYGYVTVHFDPGCQDLDSEHLLQYARVRHSDSDIGRSARQQEVIMKIREKVLSAGGVSALLPRIPELWESVQDNVKMSLTLEDIIRLAQKAEGVPSENIRQGQIGFEDVFTSTSPDGEEILVPIGTDIRLLIEDLFRPAGAPSS